MRNRKKNNIKDYIVPIITVVLIFTLIFIAIWWDEEKEDNKQGNLTNNEEQEVNNINILLWNENTQSTIIKENKEKVEVINNSPFTPWETVVVKKWYISFNISETASFSLNWNKSIWEVSYWKNSDIELKSASLWVETINPTKIKLKFWEVNIWANSIVNLKQNEVLSSFYLIKGSAEIKNKWWVNTFLSSWKKLEISNKDSYKEDIDLNILKNDFDDFFRINDWVVQNNWWIPLTNSIEESSESSNLSETWSVIESEEKNKNIVSNNSLLNFNGIYDEGFVNTSKTNISWSFIDDTIKEITINWKFANINMEKKTFNVISVNTSNKVNDLIVKVFNDNNDVISKSILTLNYQSWNKESNNLFSEINTEPYPVKSSDFIVSIPTVKEWKTYDSENTFYGTVKNPDVASVKINWYKLKTYNWKTFRYHAYTRFKTLWEWVNNYKIEYLWKNWNVILVQYETIEKLSKKVEVIKISWETKIN